MGANAVGMSTPSTATTPLRSEIESEARDRSSKKHIIVLKSGIFLMKGGRGLENLLRGGGP